MADFHQTVSFGNYTRESAPDALQAETFATEDEAHDYYINHAKRLIDRLIAG